MLALRQVHTDTAEFDQQWRDLRQKLTLQSHLLEDRERLEKVRGIVDEVRRGGDAAVARLTATFDKVDLQPTDFRIPKDVLAQAHQNMSPDLLAILRQAIENVRRYQQEIVLKERQVRWWDGSANGVRLGQLYRPMRRVGVCVPGASAPLVSTVIMTVVPAQVAGVKEIAVISAPSYQGSIHPAILGLCYELGVDEVYRISGAQAVAALALGTETIAKVDKIVGPSSWWGQLAKKEVYGLVDIDSFAGPSEVLIIADDSANAAWVAADMLSQAEHAPGSAVLVTDSQELARKVAEQVDVQLQSSQRQAETRRCVEDYCLAVVTRDVDGAVALANEFAPEHLEIQCADEDSVLLQVLHTGGNAAAIFVGQYTPVAVGDYYAGPSHTLPTGGSARFFSPLSANDFLKHSSLINYNQAALKAAAGAIEKIARTEGLDAHARSVHIRQEK